MDSITGTEEQKPQADNIEQNPKTEAGANNTDAQELKTDLSDILDSENTTEAHDESYFTFRKFKDKTEIAQNIATVLFNKKYKQRGSVRGFYNTELTRTQVGLLTQCMGLQTVASLSQLGLNLTPYADKINDTFNDVLKSLRVTEKVYKDLGNANLENSDELHLLNFNMTPYIADLSEDSDDGSGSESNDNDANIIKSCVESAANVLKAMCEMREALFRQKERYEELKLNVKLPGLKGNLGELDAIEVAERIIRYTVGWLCGACIPANQGGNKDDKDNSELIYKINNSKVHSDDSKNIIKSIGWNFFKNPSSENKNKEVYEPSLYMTYSVCSAYMSIANSVREEREQISAELKKSSTIAIDAATDEAAKAVLNVSEKLSALAVSQRQKSNLAFYASIYKQYETFRRQCIDAGRYEELQCKNASVDIASKFIGQNYTSVNYLDIENSTTNDSVINTVFHILILLYSGIDLDYETAVKKNIVAENEFYDEMQYALQNVMRRWKSLNKVGKSYIIDTYTLSFKEKMPHIYDDWIKQLRRQRIQVASLVPIMIRALNEVSRYLVRYPQKQKTEYLALVLQSRSDIDNAGNKEWAWDSDGYNLNSECYFVKELVDFYEYYATYEEPFLHAGDKEADFVDKFKREFEFKKSDFEAEKSKAISELRAEKDKELQKRDEIIRELQNRTAPLVQEVKNLIAEEFRKNLNGLLKSMLNEDDADGSTKALFNALVLEAAFNAYNNNKQKYFFGTQIKNYDDYDRAKDIVGNIVWAVLSKGFNGGY